MKILTRDFGEVEITENDIITFETKIFGFEEYSKYIMLSDDSFDGKYVWLQSVEEADLCFIMTNPELLQFNYKPTLPDNTEEITESGNYEYWLITVIKDNIKDSTVNLKSPVILNTDTNKAMQVIVDEDYPVKYKLFTGGKEQD